MPFQSTLLKALGWAIINSFWQFALLWLIYGCFAWCVFQKKAAAKHNLAYLLQGIGTVWFLGSILKNMWVASSFIDAPFIRFNTISFLSALENYLPLLGILYITILSYMVFQFIRYCYFSVYLTKNELQKIDPHYRLFVETTRRQLQIAKNIAVYVSTKVDTPLVVGFLKPFILIPVACIARLTPLQLEAILLHELQHIKRNDYFLNLLVAFSEMILFFNPFSKLLVTAIKKEREHSCDDRVLQFQYTPHQYASALLIIETLRQGKWNAGIAANGNNKKLLLHRIQRILHQPLKKDHSPVNMLLWLPLFCCSFICFLSRQEEKKDPSLSLSTPFSKMNNAAVLLSQTSKQKPYQQHRMQPVAPFPTKILPVIKNSAKTPVTVTSKYIPAQAPSFSTEKEINWQIDLRNDIAFTIPDPALNINANKAITYTEYPYIPNSSFEFYVQQDTLDPKIKTPSFNEYKNQLDKTKAKLALEAVDWKKLQSESELSNAQIQKLKLEIYKAIAAADFRKIEKEQLLMEQKQALWGQLEEAEQHRLQEEKMYLQQQALLQQYRQQITSQKLQEVQEEKRMNTLKKPLHKHQKILKVVEL